MAKREQEIPVPLHILRSVTKKYPDVWERMDLLHRMNGEKNFPSWPDWCWLPMSAANAYLSVTQPLPNSTFNLWESRFDADLISALALWRHAKEIYSIDSTLEELLAEQDDLSIPSEILLCLPVHSFYVQTSGEFPLLGQIDGFFTYLEYDPNTQDQELRLLFIKNGIPFFKFFIFLNYPTILESTKAAIQESWPYIRKMGISPEVVDLDARAETITMPLQKAMQIILYILAANAEVEEDPAQAQIRKQGRVIKDRVAEIQKWNVGYRIGTTIRSNNAYATSATRQRIQHGSHSSPRPHIRRGHWHNYWIGPRLQPENRCLVLRWIPPTMVGLTPDGTPENIPTVVHPVKP